ncbi:MAG: YbaK/EbsC family protein [Chloroflexi bacterium]|nr:MAG: YbaK/EbsC family protein [Chloroflexota bacterium]TME47041.1 MAG: YbaK/EbsC family protein [Chloroflexota bacterium]
MTQLPPASRRVSAALHHAGLSAEIREFDASTRTAQDAASAIGTTVGQIVKSLVFLAGDRPVLALVSGSNQLDTPKLQAITGRAVNKADATLVREATGYAIGGVPPAGFPSPIDTYIDQDLLQHEELWAAAGTPHHVFRITPPDLVRLTAGTVANLRRDPP